MREQISSSWRLKVGVERITSRAQRREFNEGKIEINNEMLLKHPLHLRNDYISIAMKVSRESFLFLSFRISSMTIADELGKLSNSSCLTRRLYNIMSFPPFIVSF